MDIYAKFDNIPPIYNPEYNPDNNYNGGYLIPLDKNISESDFNKTPFLFLQDHPNKYKIPDNNNPEKLKFKKLFFCPANISRIQKKIKSAVFSGTNGKFKLEADQDEHEIYLVMVKIYSEKARFIPGQIIRQIKKLNKSVVEFVLPNMLTEIQSEYGYLQEINGPLKPMPRPINVNHAGRKTLPSITTVF